MPQESKTAERVTEIIALLRPEHPPRYPESLTAAVIEGDLERMQLFLDRGANIEERSVGFASPLAAACSRGQVEAARWLIARGALLDPPGATTPPIQSALSTANCETAAVLLDAGLPVERAAWGVIAAAALGRLDVLLWLLGRGLDLDRSYPGVGHLRDRARHNAKKEGAEDLIRFLAGEHDPGPPPATPPKSPVLRKIQPLATAEDRPLLLAEALEAIRAAGTSAAHWNATGPSAPPQRQTLLAFAAATGVAEIVTALLDAGAPVNSAPAGTPPPLYQAAENAQTGIARLLLTRGAAPNGSDGKSWVPLAGAALSGEPEMVRILLDAGANPKAKPFGGRTLAQHARGPFAAEIVTMLENAPPAKRATKPKAKKQ